MPTYQNSTWLSSRKLLGCHPPNSLTAFSVKKKKEEKKLLLRSSCMLTVILNFGNWKGGGLEGGCVCLVQLLLVTGCSLSGTRHGCHCGNVLCCCVCVRKGFRSKACDSEDVWGALRCPHSRNTATTTMRPANYASSMQMSCSESEGDRKSGKEQDRESTLRQRHNGLCEGPVCAPLSLRLLFNCHVYPATTSHVISTQCSVICVVTPLHSTMGSLLRDWFERGKLTYFMWEILIHSMELFSLCLQTAMGPINFWPVHILGTAVAFNGLLSSDSHVTVYLMRQITAAFYNWRRINETKNRIHIFMKSYVKMTIIK